MNKRLFGSLRLMVCLFTGFALLPATASAEDILKAAPYITEAHLHCDQLDVSVESYCQPDENADGACFLQKVKLHHAGSGKVTEKFYLYENYLKNQSMIVQLACVKGRDKNKVVLESTNLGNCNGCEWSDYFSDTGSFLGSDRTIFGATNSKPKALPGNFFQKHGFVLDDQGHFTEIEKVWVSRELRKEK